MNNIRFYIIDNNRLLYTYGIETFEYINNSWIKTNNSEITDRLLGYDSSEENDSPYLIGNTDIMESIKEISLKEVIDRYGEGMINCVIEGNVYEK